MRTTGRRPQELNVPDIPALMMHIWATFHELASARGGNGFAPNPIGWADIAAWQQVCGMTLTSWEAETLIHLDRAVRAVIKRD